MQFTELLRYQTTAWLIYAQRVIDDPCPHCLKSYTLKCHGSLYGVDLQRPDTLRRGLRFYCSNRYSNKGCGRTFSIHFDTIIPYHTVDTQHLSTFLNKLLETQSVHQAWYQSAGSFSLRSAYRWIRKIQLNLSPLRTKIHDLISHWKHQGKELFTETIIALKETFGGANYLSRAQRKFQLPILPVPSCSP